MLEIVSWFWYNILYLCTSFESVIRICFPYYLADGAAERLSVMTGRPDAVMTGRPDAVMTGRPDAVMTRRPDAVMAGRPARRCNDCSHAHPPAWLCPRVLEEENCYVAER